MSEGPLKSSASEPHLLEEPCLHCAYPALCATCVVHWGQSGQRPGLGSDPATHQETESCHLLHALLRFYVNTVFKNYHDKAVEFGILKSFSTLANNFFVIVSKLQASVSRTKLGRRSTGDAVFSEDSSSLIWPWLSVRDAERQVSWNKAQALDTGSAGLRPGLCLTDWVSICKVVNLSLFLFFQIINHIYLKCL